MDEKLPVKVYIRKNDTGEIRLYEDYLYKSQYSGNLPETFIWEEGNYSCDCNRRLFFARVNDEPEDWESDCSDGQYSVNIEYMQEMIYSEFESAPNTACTKTSLSAVGNAGANSKSTVGVSFFL